MSAIKGENGASEDESLAGFAAGFSLSGEHASAELSYAKALDRPDNFRGDKEHVHFSITLQF